MNNDKNKFPGNKKEVPKKKMKKKKEKKNIYIYEYKYVTHVIWKCFHCLTYFIFRTFSFK